MMAQRSKALACDAVSVIGQQHMALNAYDVIFVTHSRGEHSITHHDHNIMFKVNPVNKMIHDQLLLLDGYGKILVTLRKKIRSVHKRWNVFKGKSENVSDIIFSIRKPNTIQRGMNLHVFLADNKSNEEVCDFNITGSWSKKKCAIYDSSRIIAQMRPMEATDRFTITIFSNVDPAFVITLFAIIDTMKASKNDDIETMKTSKSDDIDTMKTSKNDGIDTMRTSKNDDDDTMKTSKNDDIDTMKTSKNDDDDTMNTFKNDDIDTMETSKNDEIDTMETSKNDEIDTMETSKNDDDYDDDDDDDDI